MGWMRQTYGKLRHRAGQWQWLRALFRVKKLSTRNLHRLCEENRTDEAILVIHSEDVPYQAYFPNAFAVTKRTSCQADLYVDLFYRDIAGIEQGKYRTILCTGLLEHVPDPQRLVDDLYRLLPPGGQLILSASAVFSIHEGPHDYFHFTPFGIQVLFEKWSQVEVQGSSQPFETIGILLQRILLQCRIPNKLVVGLVKLMAKGFHLLDRFIAEQYITRNPQNQATATDSMMPSNVFVKAVK